MDSKRPRSPIRPVRRAAALCRAAFGAAIALGVLLFPLAIAGWIAGAVWRDPTGWFASVDLTDRRRLVVNGDGREFEVAQVWGAEVDGTAGCVVGRPVRGTVRYIEVCGMTVDHRFVEYLPEGASTRTDVWVMRMPAWYPVILTSLSAAWVAPSIVARLRRRHAPGSCAFCGYDLRVTPERCPECGGAVHRRGSALPHMEAPA